MDICRLEFYKADLSDRKILSGPSSYQNLNNINSELNPYSQCNYLNFNFYENTTPLSLLLDNDIINMPRYYANSRENLPVERRWFFDHCYGEGRNYNFTQDSPDELNYLAAENDFETESDDGFDVDSDSSVLGDVMTEIQYNDPDDSNSNSDASEPGDTDLNSDASGMDDVMA
jgi:hypothetical protein